MRPILIATALILGSAVIARAQEVPARLTLDEALRIAAANNPQYRQVLNDASVAAAQERQGWGAFLPSLDASATLAGSSSRAVTGEDNFGQPIMRDSPVEYRRSQSSQRLGASLTLFDGLRSFSDLQAARASSRVVDARREARAVTLRADVSRRFYDALQRERLIQLEARLLASYRERLEATERRLRVASTDPVDVLGAQVDVANQEQKVEQARGEAEKARLELLRDGLGLEAIPAFELEGDAVEPFDPSVLDVDALVAEALRSHPRVLEGEAQVTVARHRASAARGSRWPTITLDAGYSRSMSLQSYEALTELNPRNSTFSFGVTASVPVFTRFRNSAAVAQAEAERGDAEESLRATRLAIDREVRSAFIDLTNAYRAVLGTNRSAELSRQRLELAQEKYGMGALSFTDLQTLTERAAEAERQALQARFAFSIALVTLEEKVGREVRP
jgi:outer membrane protein TolC